MKCSFVTEKFRLKYARIHCPVKGRHTQCIVLEYDSGILIGKRAGKNKRGKYVGQKCGNLLQLGARMGRRTDEKTSERTVGAKMEGRTGMRTAVACHNENESNIYGQYMPDRTLLDHIYVVIQY